MSAESREALGASRVSVPTAAMACVPLTRARPSLRTQHQGLKARRRERLAPRAGLPVPARLALPDEQQGHVGQRHQVAAGAHRALLGNDGSDPGVEQGSRDSMICGRTPEYPLARVLARSSIMARQTSAESSSPTPALWLRTMLFCSCADWCSSRLISLRWPRPVVTPYTFSFLARACSTTGGRP